MCDVTTYHGATITTSRLGRTASEHERGAGLPSSWENVACSAHSLTVRKLGWDSDSLLYSSGHGVCCPDAAQEKLSGRCVRPSACCVGCTSPLPSS